VHHFGEGGLDYYLYAYSVNSDNSFKLIAHRYTHGEYSSPGYIDITDLDNDDINKILIISGEKGSDMADIFIFSVKEDRIINIVNDNNTGLAYLNIDINRDGCDEII
jgi:hypothetical protein